MYGDSFVKEAGSRKVLIKTQVPINLVYVHIHFKTVCQIIKFQKYHAKVETEYDYTTSSYQGVNLYQSESSYQGVNLYQSESSY